MPANPLQPLKRDAFDAWKAMHLLNRAGFGGTPTQIRTLANMGVSAAVDYLVDFQDVDAKQVMPDDFDRDIMRPRTADERQAIARARRSGDEARLEQARQQRQAAQRADRRQVLEMRRWWLTRMIESPRPLQEKLTLFWHGHFATGYRKIENSYHMFLQNQTFRAKAAGNVRDLTKSIIRDPAMIRYLDNQANRKQAPNENLARELMELFTLGEGNLYTEQDIKEGARALTGYNVQDDSFIFRQQMHDDGTKYILGARGRFDGDDFVDIIFSKNVCSEYLCNKLYRFFVNDTPGDPSKEGQRFVLAMAKELRRTKYELRPVLRKMFKSEHFYAAANQASLIKSPTQLVVQAIRSLRTPVRNLATLLQGMDMMGQNIFEPPSVKGWTGGRAWINTSTLFTRQNTLVYLLTGRRPNAKPWDADGDSFDAQHLIAHLVPDNDGADSREAITYLLQFVLGREPASERVEELVQFVDGNGGELTSHMLIALLSLMTAMPEYQLC